MFRAADDKHDCDRVSLDGNAVLMVSPVDTGDDCCSMADTWLFDSRDDAEAYAREMVEDHGGRVGIFILTPLAYAERPKPRIKTI